MVMLTVQLDGFTSATFSTAAQGAVRGALAAVFSVSYAAVGITSVATAATRRALLSGVVLAVAVAAPGAAAASAVASSVPELSSSPAFLASLNAALAAAGVAVRVTTVTASVTGPAPSPQASGSQSTTAIAGGVVGGIGGALTLGAAIACALRRKSSKSVAPLPSSRKLQGSSSGLGGSAGGLLGLVSRLRRHTPPAAAAEADKSRTASRMAPWLHKGGSSDSDVEAPRPLPPPASPAGSGAAARRAAAKEAERAAAAARALLETAIGQKKLFRALFGKPASPWLALQAGLPLTVPRLREVLTELRELPGATAYGRLMRLAADFAESGDPKPADLDWAAAMQARSPAAAALIAASLFVSLFKESEAVDFPGVLLSQHADKRVFVGKVERVRDALAVISWGEVAVALKSLSGALRSDTAVTTAATALTAAFESLKPPPAMVGARGAESASEFGCPRAVSEAAARRMERLASLAAAPLQKSSRGAALRKALAEEEE